MKNKLTTIFGSIAALAGGVPSLLSQVNVTLPPKLQLVFTATAVVSGTLFGLFAKDKNVTGAGESARVVE